MRAVPTTYGGGANECGIVDRGVDVRLGRARARDARDGVLRGRGVCPGAGVVGEVEAVRGGLRERVALLRARCGRDGLGGGLRGGRGRTGGGNCGVGG